MKTLLAASALLAASFLTPANADSLKFFQGTTGYTGAFSGAGTVYQVIQSTATACSTTGGTCAADDTQNTLHYNVSVTSHVGLDAIGLSSDNKPKTLDDYSPNFGGLGVISQHDDNDQINGVNVLHLQFASAVTITGLATLFDPAHVDDDNSFGGIAPGSIQGGNYHFGFSKDGTFTDLTGPFLSNTPTFNNANIASGFDISGTDFYFKALSGNPDFYISGLTYTVGTVGTQCDVGTCTAAVPGPVAGAGIPGVIAAGMFMVGLAKRRRNRAALTA